MPGQRVEITYEAFVKGVDRIQELAARTRELEDSNSRLAQKLRSAEEASAKQETALHRARHAILGVRKELFAIGFTIGAVVGTMKLLSSHSDALAERMEALGRAATKILQPLGNFIAGIFGNKGDKLSIEKRIDLLGLEADVARLRGNNAEAVRKKLQAEEEKLNESIKTLNADRQAQFRSLFEERRKLILEETRLAELGLKKQIEVWKDFQRDVVGALRVGTSDTIFKFLQGEAQSGADVAKGFQSGINRAIADAVSSAMMTSFASGNFGGFFGNIKDSLMGKNATTRAIEEVRGKIEETNRISARAADCICSTAQNTGVIAANAGVQAPRLSSMMITPPARTMLDKIGAVSNAIASIGGVFAGGGGGGPKVQTPKPGGAMHSGGFVRSYQVGGEVPILAQQGEFVVRRGVAQQNKEFLKEFNMTGDSKKTGGNVFLIKANDAQSFTDMLSSPSAQSQIEFAIIKGISANGQIRNTIKDFAK